MIECIFTIDYEIYGNGQGSLKELVYEPTQKLLGIFNKAKAVFRSRDIDIYCSILTKKELLSKPGLKGSERKKIISILRDLKTISIDPDISLKYSDLLTKYHDNRLQPPDAIIAATAWSKKLPLLTRNRRHFSYIEEIKLSPIYQ